MTWVNGEEDGGHFRLKGSGDLLKKDSTKWGGHWE